MALEKKRTLPKESHVGALAGPPGFLRPRILRDASGGALANMANMVSAKACFVISARGWRAREPFLADQCRRPESLVLYLQIPLAAWPWLRQLRGAASWAPPTPTPRPP